MQARLLLTALCLAGCATADVTPTAASLQALTLVDQERERSVPVLLYGGAGARAKPLAVLSHGYGGHNADYSFLAGRLAARGFLVASIEHLELPGDPPMAKSGNLAEARRPVWRIGADSIAFVIGRLQEQGLADRRRAPIVIGHSNGGDMTMLLASERAELMSVAVSLDNRRMPLPRTRSPRVCSARSDSHEADPGVLPSPAEPQAFNMLIAKVPVAHDDMWDGGAAPAKEAIIDVVEACIDGRATAGR